MAGPFFNSLPTLPAYPNALNPFANAGGQPLQTAAQVGSAYGTNYNNALGYNNALMQNIEQGYGQLLSSQQSAQDAIGRGYSDLANQVQTYLNPMDAAGQELRSGYANIVGRPATGGGQVRGYREDYPPTMAGQTGYAGLSDAVQGLLAGSNQSNLNDINQRFNATAGQNLSRLIGSGLGNSTIQASVNQANQEGRSRELTRSANDFAQLQASYLDRLGQAGLLAQERGLNAGVSQTNALAGLRAGYGNSIGMANQNFAQSALGMNSQLGQNQLNWLNSIQAQYPDASLFNQLIQQQGAVAQAQADRAQSQRLNDQLLRQARQGSPQIGGGVSMGTGTPLPGPQAYTGSVANTPFGVGSMYAPTGERLQAQRPTTGTYGLTPISPVMGAGLGGAVGSGAAPVGAGSAIGLGVQSYLDSLGAGDGGSPYSESLGGGIGGAAGFLGQPSSPAEAFGAVGGMGPLGGVLGSYGYLGNAPYSGGGVTQIPSDMSALDAYLNFGFE